MESNLHNTLPTIVLLPHIPKCAKHRNPLACSGSVCVAQSALFVIMSEVWGREGRPHAARYSLRVIKTVCVCVWCSVCCKNVRQPYHQKLQHIPSKPYTVFLCFCNSDISTPLVKHRGLLLPFIWVKGRCPL